MRHPFFRLPRSEARCVLADPPWRFATWDNKTAIPNSRRNGDHGTITNASCHYRTMPIEQIAELPVADLCARDALLFLWAVMPMLPAAIGVMEAWGFSYKTVAFSWAKTTRGGSHWLYAPRWHVGMGYWTRANAEVCLLGSRGDPKRLRKDVRQLIVSDVREHSRKPAEQYPRIEALCAGPRVELFARGPARPGWLTWGAEAA